MQYLESDTLMFVAALALVGWVFWLNHKRRLDQSNLKRMQLTILTNALEKFGSSADFVAFLQSREGQAVISDSETGGNGSRKVAMRFVQAGIVVTFIGAGLFLSAARYHGDMSADLQEVLPMLNFSGTTAVSMGVGLIVVALVTAVWGRWAAGSDSSST